jgi:DNA gyrase subunit A
MRLARLTGLEREKIEQELAGLRERIAQYEAILGDLALLMDVIREETLEIKEKFGDKRRTDITDSVEEIGIEDLITEESMVVTLSHSGYIKRQPVTSYRRQRHGGKGITGADHKEGDFTEHLFVASTHDHILFFTDQGRVYWLKVYDIPELGRLSRGRALVNLVQFRRGEKITSFVPVPDFEEGDLLMATRKGVVKRTSLSAYSHPRKKGIIALKLDKDDCLIGVRRIFEGQQVLLATRDGMAIRFPEERLRSMGRVSRGVRGIHLAKGDAVVGCILAEDGASALTVCANGYGKRTAIDAYRLTNRGGKGVINIKTTPRNGKVVGILEVTDEDEVMFVTHHGMIIRTPIAAVRLIGRATQGVRLVNVADNDRVVAIAKVPVEEEEEAAESSASAQASQDEPEES